MKYLITTLLALTFSMNVFANTNKSNLQWNKDEYRYIAVKLECYATSGRFNQELASEDVVKVTDLQVNPDNGFEAFCALFYRRLKD